MHCLATTSKGYRSLDPGFLAQWSRDCRVSPEIFETDRDDWAGSICRKVKTIQDPVVLWVLTDYWLTVPVDHGRLDLAEDVVKLRGAEKIDLVGQVAYWDHIDHRVFLEAT